MNVKLTLFFLSFLPICINSADGNEIEKSPEWGMRFNGCGIGKIELGSELFNNVENFSLQGVKAGVNQNNINHALPINSSCRLISYVLSRSLDIIESNFTMCRKSYAGGEGKVIFPRDICAVMEMLLDLKTSGEFPVVDLHTSDRALTDNLGEASPYRLIMKFDVSKIEGNRTREETLEKIQNLVFKAHEKQLSEDPPEGWEKFDLSNLVTCKKALKDPKKEDGSICSLQ